MSDFDPNRPPKPASGSNHRNDIEREIWKSVLIGMVGGGCALYPAISCADDAVIATVSLGEDITERRRAERERDRTQAFASTIIESVPTTIIVKALDEMGLRTRRFAELILGMLIVEDLIAVLILTALTTFATTGFYSQLVQPASNDRKSISLRAVTKDSQGKYVVVGSLSPNGSAGEDYLVARFNPDGTLDSAIQIQQDYAKSSYETLVAQATKFGELYTSLAKEAFKPVEAAVAKAQSFAK